MRHVLTILILLVGALEATDGKSFGGTRKNTEALGKANCADDRYRCEGGNKCIPLKWICDGVNDCDDKLDERNCFVINETDSVSDVNSKQSDVSQEATAGCPRSTYSCDKGAKCLLLSSLCDGLSDCEDATDERNCPLNPVCESNKFSCDENAKCFPLSWVCDSINDCNDQSDEHNCPKRRTAQSVTRAAEEAAITAAQEAKLAASAAQDFMLKAKVAAEKARRALLIAEKNRERNSNKAL
ncbi:LDL receptor repeat-containing protein egg-1-like [Montipora capricornis]|uniref:LDL receptor repeat-containing protein egg-1-like n=1 Tax=Montipora foliosa TaxID=591990 RepID=UPI0035F1C09A